MNAFLERVRQQKLTEVADGQSRQPLSELMARIADLPPRRDFGGALRAGPDRIIAEVKRRSPSVPRFLRQEPPAQLAALYHDAGAAALSLVVDRENFGTGSDSIAPMRAAAPLPLIAKEFVIDPWQLAALRNAGADCVLLIARMLSAEQLAEFVGMARAMGVETLVECHDETDVDAALGADAPLVGINNRDLDTFTMDLDTSRRLLAAMPAGVTTVVESGINGRPEVVELQERGAAAFLVGGSLLQSERPGDLLRHLRGDASAGPEVS